MKVEISTANAVALGGSSSVGLDGWRPSLFKKKQPKSEVKVAKKDQVSRVGIGLQMVAFAAILALQRRPLGPIVPMPDWLAWAVAAAANC